MLSFWIVSTRPPTSKSSRPFNNPLVIVPNAPITIGTIVTFMFHSFFNSLPRSRYLSFFSLSFRLILWSTGTAKSTILLILFFFCWLLWGLVFWPGYYYYYYYPIFCYKIFQYCFELLWKEIVMILSIINPFSVKLIKKLIMIVSSYLTTLCSVLNVTIYNIYLSIYLSI